MSSVAKKAPSGAAHPTKTTQADAPDGLPAPQAMKWWQWLLVYPTLAVAVLGAVPTVVEAYRAFSVGVPWGRSYQAREQKDLWASNLRCLEAPFEGLVNEHNVQVDATICRSGDVLVRYQGPNQHSAYRWVAAERFDQVPSTFGLLGSAHASNTMGIGPTRGAQVVCQWSEGADVVVRRMRDGAQCFEERIRTANGQVLSRRPVPCDSPCGP